MPVATRQRSNITYESDGTSESDNDSSYSSSSHPTAVKPKNRDGRGKNARNDTGRTPEQRAQELKEKFAKRQADAASSYKKKLKALADEMVEVTAQHISIRNDENSHDFAEYTALIAKRKGLELDIVNKLSEFRKHSSSLAMRLEAALAGRAAEAIDLGDCAGCKPENFKTKQSMTTSTGN